MEHRWGMAIDLDRCTGCEACVVACHAENNIPISTPTEAAKGRAFHWLRVDRYYEGEFPDVKVKYMPVMCQHCDDAPCEPVCPVYATYHNEEGLNVQVYNRCVGTRYCGNNCPYTVRFFNWFEPQWPEPLELQHNPDVAVRMNGVMEKCTFCVQRIKRGKNDASAKGARFGMATSHRPARNPAPPRLSRSATSTIRRARCRASPRAAAPPNCSKTSEQSQRCSTFRGSVDGDCGRSST